MYDDGCKIFKFFKQQKYYAIVLHITCWDLGTLFTQVQQGKKAQANSLDRLFKTLSGKSNWKWMHWAYRK